MKDPMSDYPVRVITLGSKDRPAKDDEIKKIAQFLSDMSLINLDIAIHTIPSKSDRINHLRNFNNFMKQKSRDTERY